jgi:hypothetical protein
VRVGVSAPEQDQLLTLYASFRHIPLADISGVVPGTAQGAELPSANQDWAAVKFVPSPAAPESVAISFQDGAGTAIFARSPDGNWQVAGLAGAPFGCGTRVPAAVLQAWSQPACTAAATPPQSTPASTASSTGAAMAPATAVSSSTSQAGQIARSQVGVSDNPAVQSFNGLDCDPFTAIEVSSASRSGCGIDPTFRIRDASELWCADFAKWVWRQAGVTSDIGALTPSAASFFTWGKDHHESMPKDPKNPKVGDAVVFYPGTKPNGGFADHVGIITAVNSNGTVDLANGDFLGPGNISVQGNNNVSLRAWSAQVFGAGETWTFVSPELPTATRDAAEVVGAASKKCVDTWRAKFANGGKEELWTCHHGTGQSWTYNSGGELTVDGGKYCLQVRDSHTWNGALVQLWSCTGQANQQWTFGPDGSVVGSQSGKCLSVTGGRTADGTQLIIDACTGPSDQRWSWS